MLERRWELCFRRLVQSGSNTCYDSIRFTDDSDKQCIATENVATFIKSTVPICICHKISESVIKVYMESDIFCNDMPITKSAYLNVKQGTWAMFVGKKKKFLFLRTTLIHTFRCILIQYQPFCSFWWILKCAWVRWPAVMSPHVSWQLKKSRTWAMDHENELFVLRIAPVSAVWFQHHPGQVAFPTKKKSKYVNPVNPSNTSILM